MSKADPFVALGSEALVQLGFDVQVQLEKNTAKGMRPVLWLLVQQRKKAAVAMAQMIDVDVVETEALRSLQAEVRLYGDLVQHCRALFTEGKDKLQEIEEEDRQEMEDLIGKMSPEEQRQFTNQQGTED